MRKEVKAMCQCCCEKPDKLKGKPEECTPVQIKECHGDVKNHPCAGEKKEGKVSRAWGRGHPLVLVGPAVDEDRSRGTAFGNPGRERNIRNDRFTGSPRYLVCLFLS